MTSEGRINKLCEIIKCCSVATWSTLIMYRLSHVVEYLDVDRPEIVLRSRNKIKFHSEVTKLTREMNNPYNRGIKLWDRLAEEVQKATTKVKFKMLIGNK